MSKSIKQIDKQPGIELTGFASDSSEKIFKVGIELLWERDTSRR